MLEAVVCLNKIDFVIERERAHKKDIIFLIFTVFKMLKIFTNN